MERHQNHGLTFFVVETSAVLNSILPLYKILQGVSPQMQYFGLVSFLFKNNLCETGSVCVCVCVKVSMGTHSIGDMHMIVKEGDKWLHMFMV